VIAMRPVAIAGQSAMEEETQALHGWIFGLPCSLPKSSRSICHQSRGHAVHESASFGIETRTTL